MDHLSVSADSPVAPPAARRVPRAFVQGGTLLLVEDSRLCSETVRLMFRGSGGRLRRADSLASAQRHLALYCPDCVMVDLGLPDGSGLDLIAELTTRGPKIPLIIAISGQPEYESCALNAGAARFMAKPFAGRAAFQAALAPVFFGDIVQYSPDSIRGPDTSLALRDDLYMALDLLNGQTSNRQNEYTLQFVASLARSLGDRELRAAIANARDTQSLQGVSRLIKSRLRALPTI